MVTSGVRAVSGKYRPPSLPHTVVLRERIAARIDDGERVSLISAPAGFGKTVAARHWIERAELPTGWLSLDLLDADPASFWRHFVEVVRQLVETIDDEPQLLLAERGPHDPLFLEALMAQVETSDRRVCLVLDGAEHITHRSSLDGLALLVERVGDRLRLVLTTRSEPRLPLARWRSRGWLAHVRGDELRLDDDDAIALVDLLPDHGLGADAVLSLNRWVDGWPIGLHLTLLSLQGSEDPDAEARRVAESEHVLTEYVTGEVIERLAPSDRDVALALSVLEWFDVDLCAALLGDGAVPVIRDLQRRGLFLTVIDPRRGAMRFHALFRDLLERELRWRDPAEHQRLHRRAAEQWLERGDLVQAYRHLTAVGDVDGAHRLVVQPALDLVNRGDLHELRRMALQLPTRGQVEHASLALDLALVMFFAGRADEAAAWCDHAELLASSFRDRVDDDLALRKHGMRALLALMSADLDAAALHVELHQQLESEVQLTTPFERRFPTLAARVALGANKVREAHVWLERAGGITEPPVVVEVTVPALRGWLAWQLGDLETATTFAEAAYGWAVDHDITSHHGAFEAIVTAGWCRLGGGDVTGASHLAARALFEADVLDAPWSHLQAGLLNLQLTLLTRGPQAALDVADELRATALRLGNHVLARRVPEFTAVALAGAGRLHEAIELLDGLPDSAQTRLMRARIGAVPDAQLADHLADRSTWTIPDQLTADLLIATSLPATAQSSSSQPSTPQRVHDDAVLGVVRRGAETGWVLPFLGHGAQTAAHLRSLPLASLHPRLATALALTSDGASTATSTPGSASTATSTPGSDPDDPGDSSPAMAGTTTEHFTSRELTLLALLPTHLSYAQIGERLYLSVNTVKTNLKSVYRKLGAGSRSDAVDRARAAGLL